MRYELRQITTFIWGVYDTETNEIVAETTYYGAKAIAELFNRM